MYRNGQTDGRVAEWRSNGARGTIIGFAVDDVNRRISSRTSSRRLINLVIPTVMAAAGRGCRRRCNICCGAQCRSNGKTHHRLQASLE